MVGRSHIRRVFANSILIRVCVGTSEGDFHNIEFMSAVRESSQGFQAATLFLFSLGAMTMIAHAFTGAGFGFDGSELQTLDDAHHLSWGYVAYPPMTPFFARLTLDLFGISIAGFRFFASLAQAVSLSTGLMAREMGGDVRAQVLAGAAVVPYALGADALGSIIYARDVRSREWGQAR